MPQDSPNAVAVYGCGKAGHFPHKFLVLPKKEDYEVAKNSDHVCDHDAQNHLALESAAAILPSGPSVEAGKTCCQ